MSELQVAYVFVVTMVLCVSLLGNAVLFAECVVLRRQRSQLTNWITEKGDMKSDRDGAAEG